MANVISDMYPNMEYYLSVFSGIILVSSSTENEKKEW